MGFGGSLRGFGGYLHEELEGAVIAHPSLAPCLRCQSREPDTGDPELVVGGAQPLEPPPLPPRQEPCAMGRQPPRLVTSLPVPVTSLPADITGPPR